MKLHFDLYGKHQCAWCNGLLDYKPLVDDDNNKARGVCHACAKEFLLKAGLQLNPDGTFSLLKEDKDPNPTLPFTGGGHEAKFI